MLPYCIFLNSSSHSSLAKYKRPPQGLDVYNNFQVLSNSNDADDLLAKGWSWDEGRLEKAFSKYNSDSFHRLSFAESIVGVFIWSFMITRNKPSTPETELLVKFPIES